MKDLLIIEALGVFLLMIGILNTKGNIDFIHRYHRHRVREEDILPYGRLMGAGTIIAAISTMIFGATQYLAELVGVTALSTVGTIVMTGGVVVAMVICFYAIFKYNKGIF